jgi:hypothetical protein
MSPEKVLHKIQVQIKDVVPSLEFFIEHTIQPTVDECEGLQKQLAKLQENLTIYRYIRENNEVSPSFNLHAKVSEVIIPEPLVEKEKVEPPKETIVPETPQIKSELKEAILESIKSEPAATVKHIAVGINDKFRFINELFSQNNSEYSIAVEQLNTLSSWHDAEIYLNSLKNLYVWKESSEITRHFYTVVKKRFD